MFRSFEYRSIDITQSDVTPLNPSRPGPASCSIQRSTSMSALFSRQLRAALPLGSPALPFSSRAFAVQRNARTSFLSSPAQCAEALPGPRMRRSTLPTLYSFAGVAGLGLGLSLFAAPKIFCEPTAVTSKTATPVAAPAAPPPAQAPPPPPPQSSVSYYELTFGTVCGVCAGVFVKKGAKALAFVFGGVFVLLQYLGSLSLVRVDWGRAAGRFENLFYTTDAGGAARAPTLGSLFRWIVDFLIADFQQRASFVAGFALGLRVG
ncbi:FUN14 family-domain-containing protein [Amylocystis lapponica]|nr:FUN14 family-domain-containing protein [Amylocystis lapponica]